MEAALARNPAHRPHAADLLKHEALNPPREDQPRCQSLDSALLERKRLLSRKELELAESITGRGPLPRCGVGGAAPFSVHIRRSLESSSFSRAVLFFEKFLHPHNKSCNRDYNWGLRRSHVVLLMQWQSPRPSIKYRA